MDKEYRKKLIAILKKCAKEDAKPGRPWCIYRHAGEDRTKIQRPQPKGWPKTYKSKKDAKNGLKWMHVFGETNTLCRILAKFSGK